MKKKKIKVLIAWTGRNYCAGTANGKINGNVIAAHKTLEGIKTEFESAFRFHVEFSIIDGDYIPEYIIQENYEFEYKWMTPNPEK